jgi:hypothetical protein
MAASVLFAAGYVSQAAPRQFLTYASLPKTVDELISVSDLIADGDVAAIIPPEPDQELQWTDVVVNVRRVIKGTETKDSFLVSFGRLEFALSRATIRVGDRYILFVKSMNATNKARLPVREARSRYTSHGEGLGPFHVDGSKVSISDSAFDRYLAAYKGTDLNALLSEVGGRVTVSK